MRDIFDRETIERLRKLPPREAFEKAKDAVYRLGPVSSHEFSEVFDELVRRGVLSRAELDRMNR